MICSNCGKEIMDGATYCLECGAPIDEPVVLKDVKPKNMEEALAGGEIIEKGNLVEDFKNSFRNAKNYQGPFLNFSGYVKSLGSDTPMLLGLISAILVYLSPFFSWLWKEHFEVRDSANLFELGGKHAELALHSGLLIAMAVLIMLSAIDMLVFSGCKYIGPLKAFEKNYIIRILPAVLALIFLLVVLKSKDYSGALEFINNQEAKAEDLGTGFNFSGGMGLGVYMLILGDVLYVTSVLMSYMKRNK